MKKSTAIIISSIAILACVLCWEGTTDYLAVDNSPMAIAIREGRPLPESLFIQVQGVSENSSYSNVSLSIINEGSTLVTLDKIQMEGKSVLTIIDGTEIADPSQMNYTLEKSATAQVNLILPNANYYLNASIVVYTPEAMYYQEAAMP
jgi:archaellum component FlaF (FlaF/FlaG flagellin family)